MKYFIYCLFLLPFLIGCSVTVDEASTEENAGETTIDTFSDGNVFLNESAELEENALQDLMNRILQKESSSEETFKVLALGDSLTVGVGDEDKQHGYVGRLAESMEQWPAITKVETDNRGKKGRKSDKLLKLLERGHYDEELAAVQLVTMTMGGNDVMKIVRKDLLSLKRKKFDKEREAFSLRYAKIIENIRLRNDEVPLVLIGFYNPFSIVTEEDNEFDKIITEWNVEIEKIASEDVNACYVNVADLFESNEEIVVYHSDFFHPNASGYEKMTNRIVESMAQCGLEEQIIEAQAFEE